MAPVGRGRRRRLIARAATLVQPRHPCLLEALLLWWEALAAGEPASLVVGAETAPLFAAHAWVERQDGSLLGPSGPGPGMVRLAVWGPDGALPPGRCDG